ncbi:hypothetical protein BDZ89DRAFT_1070700 [Hymenopellis radicata]|nr:hypothetical protein BDZ89DRAFT_1070700 [Hymenopellis radicata]
MVRDHPRHGQSPEISLRHLPDLSDDLIGNTSLPGSTFDDSFEIPTNIRNTALANMTFNPSEVDASFQIPTGSDNDDLLLDVDDDFFRTGARCDLTLSQLAPSPKKGKSPRKTTMSPKKIVATSPSPRKAPLSRSPTPQLRRSPRKHTSPIKLEKADNVRMASPTPKRKSKVERSPLPSPSRFDSLRMEVQMLAPIQLNQEHVKEDMQEENKMLVDEDVSIATPKKQAISIAADMMMVDDRVGSENKLPHSLVKPTTPKTPRHEPLRLSHLSPLKTQPHSSPIRTTDNIQSSPEAPDSSSDPSPLPSEPAAETSSEQLTPTPTAPPSPMKPATKRAASSPPDSEDDGQKEPAKKRDRKDIQQEKTRGPLVTTAKKAILSKKEASHSAAVKKTSQTRNKVVPVRAAVDRKKPAPSSSLPSQPKPPSRAEFIAKSANVAKPQPPRKPDSRTGNEAQRPVHRRTDSKPKVPEVSLPVVPKEPTRAVSAQPKEPGRPEKQSKPRSIPPQNRGIPAGNRPGSSTSNLPPAVASTTVKVESVASMSEEAISRGITPRPGSSQDGLNYQTEIRTETEHSLEPIAVRVLIDRCSRLNILIQDTVAPAPERLAFVKEEEIEEELEMNVETTTNMHVRSQSRSQATSVGHSNSASTSTSRHAPSVPLSAIKARMGLAPTIPHSPQFTTKKRLVSRHAFDEQLREKEREKELERDEERKRREVEEERELKERRKALVIKAHEVPEWYKDVPRKGGKGE